MSIFIPGEVPSLKNSKQVVRNSNGRTFIVSSATVQKYRKSRGILYKSSKTQFKAMCRGKDYPLHVGLFFTRKTLGKFDYINIAQIVMDMMVDYNWIPDDDMAHVIPVFIGYNVDKKDPGVKITVI